MSVSCKCCVLSGRGLCVGLITRPDDSYRLWYVVVCDHESSTMNRSWHNGGCCVMVKKKKIHTILLIDIFRLSPFHPSLVLVAIQQFRLLLYRLMTIHGLVNLISFKND